MKVGEVKGLMYEIPRPSTPSRSSSIRPYAAYGLDDWWCSHWLERRGGNGVDELLEVMVIVEREKEMNKIEDAWTPDSRTASALLPSAPIAPFTHVSSTTSTSTTEQVRIRRPTKFTRLRSSTPTGAV